MPDESNVPPPGSRAYQRGAHDDRVTPSDLRVLVREQRLEIDWSDGERSEYSLGQLRKNCPCAECRSERDKQSANPLKILKSDPSSLRVVSAELVGNYAIRFDWSDGHNTGIFDFRYLRALADERK